MDNHIVTCEACAGRLAEYMEVSAIFSSETRRAPEPELRAGVFQQIHKLKEEERLARRRAEESRPWYLPARPSNGRGSRSAMARTWELVSPFAAAAMAVFAILAFTFFSGKGPVNRVVPDKNQVLLPPVPTSAAPIASSSLSNNDANNAGSVPPPVATSKPVDATFSPTSLVVTTFPTAILGEDELVRVARPRPVMEDGDITAMADWHLAGDPTYGYSIAYPPNWWTQAAGPARYFFPWVPGGTTFAPYWLDLRVEDNAQGLTATTYNTTRLRGKGTVVPVRGSRATQLRYLHSDNHNGYDEIYSFDPRNIYVLRVSVPHESATGEYSVRWSEAEDIFSRMSGRLTLPAGGTFGLGYAPVLFLNGSDLWMMDPSREQARAVTAGSDDVRQFALSPDLKTAAFTATKSKQDLWGRAIYLVRLDNLDAPPIPLWSDMALIHDIAWYSDHELVAIAEATAEGLGVYKVTVPEPAEGSHPLERVTRIAALPENKVSARGLSVSPDRQLITFLAPISESAGTDVFALRPDGSDLMKLLSHTDPLPVSPGGVRILTPDNQAIKSYVWTSGHLEHDGYRFHMLFTCGKSDSPTLYKGGFLFSSSGATLGPLLNQEVLGVSRQDAAKMEIVHLAYAAEGKVAMTGYFNDRGGRADQLAGLWTADIVDGGLANIRPLPGPENPHGITDLQWSPDGESLIYRETMPQNASDWSDRYNGLSPFRLVKLELGTQRKSTLYLAGE